MAVYRAFRKTTSADIRADLDKYDARNIELTKKMKHHQSKIAAIEKALPGEDEVESRRKAKENLQYDKQDRLDSLKSHGVKALAAGGISGGAMALIFCGILTGPIGVGIAAGVAAVAGLVFLYQSYKAIESGKEAYKDSKALSAINKEIKTEQKLERQLHRQEAKELSAEAKLRLTKLKEAIKEGKLEALEEKEARKEEKKEALAEKKENKRIDASLPKIVFHNKADGTPTYTVFDADGKQNSLLPQWVEKVREQTERTKMLVSQGTRITAEQRSLINAYDTLTNKVSYKEASAKERAEAWGVVRNVAVVQQVTQSNTVFEGKMWFNYLEDNVDLNPDNIPADRTEWKNLLEGIYEFDSQEDIDATIDKIEAYLQTEEGQAIQNPQQFGSRRGSVDADYDTMYLEVQDEVLHDAEAAYQKWQRGREVLSPEERELAYMHDMLRSSRTDSRDVGEESLREEVTLRIQQVPQQGAVMHAGAMRSAEPIYGSREDRIHGPAQPNPQFRAGRGAGGRMDPRNQRISTAAQGNPSSQGQVEYEAKRNEVRGEVWHKAWEASEKRKTSASGTILSSQEIDLANVYDKATDRDERLKNLGIHDLNKLTDIKLQEEYGDPFQYGVTTERRRTAEEKSEFAAQALAGKGEIEKMHTINAMVQSEESVDRNTLHDNGLLLKPAQATALSAYVASELSQSIKDLHRNMREIRDAGGEDVKKNQIDALVRMFLAFDDTILLSVDRLGYREEPHNSAEDRQTFITALKNIQMSNILFGDSIKGIASQYGLPIKQISKRIAEIKREEQASQRSSVVSFERDESVLGETDVDQLVEDTGVYAQPRRSMQQGPLPGGNPFVQDNEVERIFGFEDGEYVVGMEESSVAFQAAPSAAARANAKGITQQTPSTFRRLGGEHGETNVDELEDLRSLRRVSLGSQSPRVPVVDDAQRAAMVAAGKTIFDGHIKGRLQGVDRTDYFNSDRLEGTIKITIKHVFKSGKSEEEKAKMLGNVMAYLDTEEGVRVIGELKTATGAARVSGTRAAPFTASSASSTDSIGVTGSMATRRRIDLSQLELESSEESLMDEELVVTVERTETSKPSILKRTSAHSPSGGSKGVGFSAAHQKELYITEGETTRRYEDQAAALRSIERVEGLNGKPLTDLRDTPRRKGSDQSSVISHEGSEEGIGFGARGGNGHPPRTVRGQSSFVTSHTAHEAGKATSHDAGLKGRVSDQAELGHNSAPSSTPRGSIKEGKLEI